MHRHDRRAEAPPLRGPALFERYRRHRDPADRELLVERFRALALHLSRKYHSRGERDDLEQIACLALLKAIERYDPSKGVAFSSFAVPTIIGELKRYFRDFGWSVRVPRSLQELNLRITAATEALSLTLGRAPTVEELAERCETTPEHVVEALSLGSAHRADSLDAPTGRDDHLWPRIATISYDEPGYAEAERAADVERLLAHPPAHASRRSCACASATTSRKARSPTGSISRRCMCRGCCAPPRWKADRLSGMARGVARGDRGGISGGEPGRPDVW